MMKKILVMIFVFLSLLTGPALPQTAGTAEEDLKKYFLYEWKDDKGDVHIADDLGNVPEHYRSRAQKHESKKGPEVTPGQQRDSGKGYSKSSSFDDEAGKAQWQQRLMTWKSQLRQAENRYRELEREKNELFRAWGSAALAPIEKRLEADQLDQKMKDVLNEIDEARRMIDTIIPEEARKAGVPPGWLRE